MTESEHKLPKPKIYQDPSSMYLSNQTMFRKNYLAEILSQQEKTNQALAQTVRKVKTKLKKNQFEQHSQYTHLLEKLENQEKISADLKSEVQLNDINNKDVIDRLNNLESMSEEVGKCLEEEMLMSQAALDQLSFQEDLAWKIHKKLADYEGVYLDIQEKMKEQEHIYEQIDEKLQIQDMFHQSVMERMDKQDANTQKIAKQIDHLRDSIMEKIEAAIQSIEVKYKQTIHFFGGFFNGKEKLIHKIPIQKDKKVIEKKEINEKQR